MPEWIRRVQVVRLTYSFQGLRTKRGLEDSVEWNTLLPGLLLM
jgi:hypothetical protein